jgi:hypothetical protein
MEVNVADFTNIPEAIDAIRQMELNDYATLPEPVKRVLDDTAALGSSPVDRVVKTAEAIYACRDKVKKEHKETGAKLMSMASLHGWHGVNENGRAGKVAKVLRDGDETDAPEVARAFRPDDAPIPADQLPPPATLGKPEAPGKKG